MLQTWDNSCNVKRAPRSFTLFEALSRKIWRSLFVNYCRMWGYIQASLCLSAQRGNWSSSYVVQQQDVDQGPAVRDHQCSRSLIHIDCAYRLLPIGCGDIFSVSHLHAPLNVFLDDIPWWQQFCKQAGNIFNIKIFLKSDCFSWVGTLIAGVVNRECGILDLHGDGEKFNISQCWSAFWWIHWTISKCKWLAQEKYLLHAFCYQAMFGFWE